MSYDDRLSDYNDVASRMREFFERYPDGRLRAAGPWRVETIGEKPFVVYQAAAFRTADDPAPGIGTAWEPFPGGTPFTKDSELMNAETSAWGRAILAVGAADTKKGIASAEEVRNRQQQDPEQMRRNMLASAFTAIAEAADREQFDRIDAKVEQTQDAGVFTRDDVTNLRRFSALRLAALFPADEQKPIAAPVDQRQHKRMHALWREVGLGGTEHRETRLTRTSLIVGRDVDSSAQLTAAEADRVIEALEAERKRAQEPPQAEPPVAEAFDQHKRGVHREGAEQ